MKKTLLIAISLTVLLFASECFAATYYFKTAGVNNNWSNALNWCTETNGAGTCGTAPTASDDAVLDSNSGAVTIDTTTCVAKTLTCTGYSGELTFTAAQTLIVSGNVTFAATHTIAGTGTLRLGTAGNLTSAGLSIPNLTLFASAATALQDALSITGALTNSGGANTAFTGAFDISCATYTSAYALAIAVGQTLTVSTALNLSAGSFGADSVLKSGTPGTHIHLIYNGLASAGKVAGTTFTDVVYSGGTVTTLYTWYGAVSGDSSGITVATSASIGGGGGAWAF